MRRFAVVLISLALASLMSVGAANADAYTSINDRLQANDEQITRWALRDSTAESTPSGTPVCATTCDVIFADEHDPPPAESAPKRAWRELNYEIWRARWRTGLAPSVQAYGEAPNFAVDRGVGAFEAGLQIGTPQRRLFYGAEFPSTPEVPGVTPRGWNASFEGHSLGCISGPGGTCVITVPFEGSRKDWSDAVTWREGCPGGAIPEPDLEPGSYLDGAIGSQWLRGSITNPPAPCDFNGDGWADGAASETLHRAHLVARFSPLPSKVYDPATDDALNKDDHPTWKRTIPAGGGTWEGLVDAFMTEILNSPDRYPQLRRWLDHLLGGASADPTSESTALADKFRPILRFDRSERWRPLDVEAFLAEGTTYPGSNHHWCPSSTSEMTGCAPILDSASLAGYPSDANSRIKVHGTPGDPDSYRSPNPACVVSQSDPELPDRLDCDSGNASAIYYHVVDSGGYRYLDYWWLYRFNKFDINNLPDFSDHEGDWEGMSVAIPTSGNPEAFDFVTIDAHDNGPWRYLRGVLQCDGSTESGSCGTETGRMGARVAVFVASGSHASYPQACELDCSQTSNDTIIFGEMPYGGQATWGRNDDPTALLPFPLALSPWLDFPGRWGMPVDRQGTDPSGLADGPLSPSHQDRFTDPGGYTCTERYNDSDDSCGSLNGRLATSTAARSPSPKRAGSRDDAVCDPWFPPGVKLTVCNADKVRQAVKLGTLGRSSDLNVEGIAGASDTAFGLVQVVGNAIRGDDDVQLRGRLLRGARVTTRTQASGRTIVETFDIPVDLARAELKLRRAASGRATIQSDGHAIRPSDREVLHNGP